MELLFFLVILGIQFAYQIYIAVNKRRARKKEANIHQESSHQEEFGSTDSSPALSETQYGYNGDYQEQVVQDPIDEERVGKSPQSRNFYEQFFGFIEDAENSSQAFSSIDSEQRSRTPSAEYAMHDTHEPSESQDEGYFSYDDVFEDEGRSEAVIPPRVNRRGRGTARVPSYSTVSRKERDVHVLDGDESKKNSSSYHSRIRKQLRNANTFKDSWRIKFILDRPGGLTGERDFK